MQGKIAKRWLSVGVGILLALPLAASAEPAQAASTDREVLEEIVARVNNDIITRSDVERSRELLRRELSQRSQNSAEVDKLFQESEPGLLRDLIDQRLLAQRGTDMGLSVEAEVIKQLDELRQQMKLDSMEALERAMAIEGIAFQDYKQQLRDHLLSQQVIQREVSSRVFVRTEAVREYYLTHRQEFFQPERLHLREILVSTEGRSPEELPAREERMREVLAKILKGDKFDELARQYSDAPTAEGGGELGFFEPARLAPAIRDVVSKLLPGGVSDPIKTPQGWLVLQLVEHQESGIPTFEAAENQIRDKLFMTEVQPTLREFLNELRRDAYVYVKSGFVDTGAVEEAQKPLRRGSRRSHRRRRD